MLSDKAVGDESNNDHEYPLSDDTIRYIISRVIENAYIVRNSVSPEERNDFTFGQLLSYYEVLDTIKNELEIYDQDLKEFGLDIDLDKEFL